MCVYVSFLCVLWFCHDDRARRGFLAAGVPVVLKGIGGPRAPHVFQFDRREGLSYLSLIGGPFSSFGRSRWNLCIFWFHLLLPCISFGNRPATFIAQTHIKQGFIVRFRGPTKAGSNYKWSFYKGRTHYTSQRRLV